MAIIWRDGFDYYNGQTDLATLYNTTSAYKAFVAGRTDGDAIELTAPSAPGTNSLAVQVANESDLTAHFALFPITAFAPANRPIFQMQDSASGDILLSFGISNNGNNLNINGVLWSYSFAIPLVPQSNWTQFGVRLLVGASGTVQVWQNGQSIFSQSGIDTRGSGGSVTTVNQIAFVAVDGNADVFQPMYAIDDFILSTAGYLGDVRIQTDLPSADHSVQFTHLSGTSNFAMVDETAMDFDTTYNYTSTVGNTDLFVFGTISIPSGSSVLEVSLQSAVRKTDAGSRAFQHKLVSGTTTALGTVDANVGSSYQYQVDAFANDPNTGSPWTQTAINAAYFGYLLEG